MFDHIMLKVKDLDSSKRFYSAALAPLGFSVQYDGDGIVVFGPKDAPAAYVFDWPRANRPDLSMLHSWPRTALP